MDNKSIIDSISVLNGSLSALNLVKDVEGVKTVSAKIIALVGMLDSDKKGDSPSGAENHSFANRSAETVGAIPKVRAKFSCSQNLSCEGEQHQVVLTAVVDGSEENKSFSRWTPAGSLNLTISDESAAGELFEVGEEYYLDISRCE